MITVSDSAADKVKQLVEAEGGEVSLRVAVRPGGCSGFSYEMFFDSEIGADDLKVDANGIRVVMDQASAPMLKGAVLDFKDGLNQAGFSINNPNAQRTCGCGQSFS